MKRLTTIILLLCMVLTIGALDERQTKINSIKKSKAYLYSDITVSTLEDATSQAYDLLQQEIFNWVLERADNKSGSAVSPKEINRLIDTIMVRRVEMYRVFAYVRKVELVPLFTDWKLELIDTLDADDGFFLVEQAQEQPDDTVAKERHNDTVANEEILTLLKNSFMARKGGVIEQIKKAKNFFELKKIMEPLKQKGYIIDYGKYATAKKIEDCYLIVYDPAGNIRAVLDKGEKVRHNLQTGKEDGIQNYRGCGAIWFTLREE